MCKEAIRRRLAWPLSPSLSARPLSPPLPLSAFLTTGPLEDRTPPCAPFSRAAALLTPDASKKAVDSEGMRASAELAAAALPEGESHLEKVRKLRAQMKSYDNELTSSGSKGASLSAQASLPPDAEMVATIEHVREVATRLAIAAHAAPEPHDKRATSHHLGKIDETKVDERLGRFGGSLDDPFPLDDAIDDHTLPAETHDHHELSLSVIEHVNRLRTKPQEAAALLRKRMRDAFDGKVFTPPWLKGGKSVTTKEGAKALEDLCERLERTPPLNALEHLPALQGAAMRLGEELAAGKERKSCSAIEDRLKTVGTWSGVAGEAVMYGVRLPEAIVTMMMLCDGDATRKNRSFVLNPDVKFACFASTEVEVKKRTALSGGVHGPIGVLSLLSHFYPSLKEEVSVEFQGPVEKRRRPMPEDMARVLRAIPSDEACDLALTALAKGKHLKLDYKLNSVVITVTDSKGASQVSRLKWR